MFGTLGGPELILILVIALIVFGPRKLPEMGKSLGKMMLEFRKASNEFRRTIEDEVEAEKQRAAPPPARLPAAAGAAEPAPEAALPAEPAPAQAAPPDGPAGAPPGTVPAQPGAASEDLL